MSNVPKVCPNCGHYHFVTEVQHTELQLVNSDMMSMDTLKVIKRTPNEDALKCFGCNRMFTSNELVTEDEFHLGIVINSHTDT